MLCQHQQHHSSGQRMSFTLHQPTQGCHVFLNVKVIHNLIESLNWQISADSVSLYSTFRLAHGFLSHKVSMVCPGNVARTCRRYHSVPTSIVLLYPSEMHIYELIHTIWSTFGIPAENDDDIVDSRPFHGKVNSIFSISQVIVTPSHFMIPRLTGNHRSLSLTLCGIG